MNLKEYQKKIEQIKADCNRNAEEISEKLREYKTKAEEASEEMKAALDSGDDAAYTKALTARNVALSFIDSYEERARRFNTGPMISEEEYNALISGITSEIRKTCNNDKRKVLNLCEQIKTIAAGNLATVEEGNRLLHEVQAGLYRYTDCSRTKEGSPILYSGAEKAVNDYDLSVWTDAAINNNAHLKDIRDRLSDQ